MNIFTVFLLVLCISFTSAGCPYLKSLKNSKENVKFKSKSSHFHSSPHAQILESDILATSDDPFTFANEQFLNNYKSAKHSSITSKLNYPVILATGNDLRLLLNGTLSGTIVSENMIPDLYTKLKVVAHTPLNIYAILFPYVYNSENPNKLVALDEDAINIIQKSKQIYQDLYPAIYETKWASGIQRDRQILMLSTVINFMDSIIGIKQVSYDQLVSFTKSLEEPIVNNINAAGKYQIEAVHGIVQAWKRMYLSDQWDNLRVLVSGTHFASNENLVSQYFKWQLSNPNHVIISGEPMNDDELFYILSVTLVDTDVGSTFFQDSSFMHADVLRNAARAWIDYQRVFAGIPDG